MARYLKQKEYDLLYDGSLSEGLSYEVAFQDVREVSEENQMLLDYVIEYKSENEKKIKESIEKKFLVLVNTSLGKDTIVNSTFSIQNFNEIFQNKSQFELNCLIKFIHGQKASSVLLKILGDLYEEFKEKDEDSDGNDSDEIEDSDDEEEDFLLKKENLWNFFNLILTHKSILLNFNESFQLSPEEVSLFDLFLDQDSDKPRPLVPLLSTLSELLTVQTNIESFKETSFINSLELISKMNKKNENIIQLVNLIKSKL